jgi:dTDP-4-dehydrorhamnose reductase
MRMKILVFGRNGQVGWELQRSLAPLGEVVAVDRASQDHCGDLAQPEGVRDTIRALRPDVIVNAAAYTAVDKAESEVDLCRRVNALAPEVMAQEAGRLGGWLVHYSTDYVFDGTGNRPWREDDAIAPLSVYGASKAEGEAEVRAAVGRHVILRTSWIYSETGRNFLTTMLRLGRERAELAIVDDQIGAPTYAADVAGAIARIVESVLDGADDEMWGTFHFTSAGSTSWFGFAAEIFAQAQARGWPAPKLKPITTAEYPTPARRPAYSVLDTAKIARVFDIAPPDWQEALERCMARVAEIEKVRS